MGRHKTPLKKAKLTGAAQKHPERYRDRSEPDGGPSLGKPPTSFTAQQKRVWAKFVRELPWLVEADRALVEVATITRAMIEESPGGATAALFREHRQQLASLGGTPVTRGNVSVPPNSDDDDPFAKFDQGRIQ